MQVIRCNMCGKDFTNKDRNEGFNKKHKFGYDSERENQELELDLCIECTEREIERWIKECVISPIKIDTYRDDEL